MSCQHGNWPPCDLCNEIDAAYLNGHKHATESDQAELAELRAIVARLREPATDKAVSGSLVEWYEWNGLDVSDDAQHVIAMRESLNAYRKRILGETE